MIEQVKQSWNKGRADAVRGMPSKCPTGLDRLAYANGYIEGKAHQAKRLLREARRQIDPSQKWRVHRSIRPKWNAKASPPHAL